MDANILATQFGSSFAVVYGMQLLKNASWFPWLVHEGQVLRKRALSIFAAICIHTGISYVWTNGAANSNNLGSLLITIPTFSVMAVTVWHWFIQYAMQETMYQTTWNKGNANTGGTK